MLSLLSDEEEEDCRAELDAIQEVVVVAVVVVGCAPMPGTKELTRDGKSTRRTIQECFINRNGMTETSGRTSATVKYRNTVQQCKDPEFG